jgi:hypothetical protein
MQDAAAYTPSVATIRVIAAKTFITVAMARGRAERDRMMSECVSTS